MHFSCFGNHPALASFGTLPSRKPDGPKNMRIAIAGISHETNTFCRDKTPLADFRVLRGQAMLDTRGQETDVGGMIDACDALGVEPVPVLFATTEPSGVIESAAYAGLRDEIIAGVRAAGCDAVALALHGAGVADGATDLEADLAIAVRTAVGDTVPVVATFDLHGNITQRMADALNGVFACHQYPHVDMHERSREAIELIVRMLREGLRPAVHVERLPMVLPTTTTLQGIGKDMLEQALAAEAREGIIDVSWFHGFGYADTPEIASTVVVTAAADPQRAAATAKNVASQIWDKRESFRGLSLSAGEAVAQAVNASRGPVVINETSDNCGGGAPGDGTHLLRAMLDAKLERACFGFIVDPEVARQAHATGVGQRIQVSLGAKYDSQHGRPIETDAQVRALHDGRLTLQAMFRGMEQDLGPLARLTINGVDVVVSSNRSQTFDAEPFLAVGIDVARYHIVALKSSNHFRGYFQDRAAEIITADPPGMTSLVMESFARPSLKDPMWPIDPMAHYTP